MGGRGSKSQMSGGVSVGAAGGGGGLNGPAAQFQVQTNPPNIVPTAQQAAQLNSSVYPDLSPAVQRQAVFPESESEY